MPSAHATRATDAATVAMAAGPQVQPARARHARRYCLRSRSTLLLGPGRRLPLAGAARAGHPLLDEPRSLKTTSVLICGCARHVLGAPARALLRGRLAKRSGERVVSRLGASRALSRAPPPGGRVRPLRRGWERLGAERGAIVCACCAAAPPYVEARMSPERLNGDILGGRPIRKTSFRHIYQGVCHVRSSVGLSFGTSLILYFVLSPYAIDVR